MGPPIIRGKSNVEDPMDEVPKEEESRKGGC